MILNLKQKKVVDSSGKSLSNIAGPGSGKTSTLIEKIKKIAVEEGIESLYKTLVLTFTNSAAIEVRERALSSITGFNPYKLSFGTFHSIFRLLILKENGYDKIGFTHNPTIFTPSELNRHFLMLTFNYFNKNYKELFTFIKDLGFEDNVKFNRTLLKKEFLEPKTLLNLLDFEVNRLVANDMSNLNNLHDLNKLLISKTINRAIDKYLSNIEQEENSLFGRGLLVAYNSNIINKKDIEIILDSLLSELLDIKFKQSIFSFGDIMSTTLFILVKEKDIALKIRNSFKYVFVDEYQDTNTIQKEILKLIYNKNNICVIGDPYQSIYSFLGANVRNILEAKKDFNAEIIQLVENYRSNENIVELTNYIASNMTEKLEEWKPCISSGNKNNNKINIYSFCEEKEQRNIVIDILNNRASGETIGILNRKGNDFITEGFLSSSNYQYNKLGGLSLKESVEVQTLVNLLNFIINPNKALSFLFIVEKVSGIGTSSISKYQEEPDGKISPKIVKLIKEIEDLRILLKSNNNLHSFFHEIKTFYFKTFFGKISKPWKNDRIEEAEQKIDIVLEELMERKNLQEIENFLNEYLLNDNDIKNKDKKDITVSTIHSAKGLEWDHVILIDWGYGSFKRDEEAEAERLNYVAISRAKENLSILSEENIFGIPQEYIESETNLFNNNQTKASLSNIIRFGKFKGQEFSKLPSDYLFWLWDEQSSLVYRKLLNKQELILIQSILNL